MARELPDKRLLGFATLASVIFLSILQFSALASSPLIIRSSGTIESGLFFVVALDGSGDFSNIQRAIDAVPEGEYGDILVKQGTYVLNPVQKWLPNYIVAKPRIRLRGEGIDKTIIVMSPPEVALGVRHDVITTEADVFDFTLQDLTVNQNAPEPDNAGSSIIAFRGGTARNVIIQRVKVINGFGAAIGIDSFQDVTVKDCVVSNTWSGVVYKTGDSLLITGSDFTDIGGNGVNWNGGTASNIDVEYSTFTRCSDTGVGYAASGVISDVSVKYCDFINCHMGFSHIINLHIEGNTVTHSSAFQHKGFGIYADLSQGYSSNVMIINNVVSTYCKRGIALYGVENGATISGNTITMFSSNQVDQVGIVPVRIIGSYTIENNTVIGGDYSVYWEGWGNSDSSPVIRENNFYDFDKISIYDGGYGQGTTLVENNLIWDRRVPFLSTYGIRTDRAWTIRYNHVYAGSIDFIYAPQASLSGNTFTEPNGY